MGLFRIFLCIIFFAPATLLAQNGFKVVPQQSLHLPYSTGGFSIKATDDHKFLAIAGQDQLIIWDNRTKLQYAAVKAKDLNKQKFVFGKDNRTLVYVKDDETIEVYDFVADTVVKAITLAALPMLKREQAYITSIDINPFVNHLLVCVNNVDGNDNDRFYIIRMADMQTLYSSKKEAIRVAMYHPNGFNIITYNRYSISNWYEYNLSVYADLGKYLKYEYFSGLGDTISGKERLVRLQDYEKHLKYLNIPESFPEIASVNFDNAGNLFVTQQYDLKNKRAFFLKYFPHINAIKLQKLLTLDTADILQMQPFGDSSILVMYKKNDQYFIGLFTRSGHKITNVMAYEGKQSLEEYLDEKREYKDRSVDVMSNMFREFDSDTSSIAIASKAIFQSSVDLLRNQTVNRSIRGFWLDTAQAKLHVVYENEGHGGSTMNEYAFGSGKFLPTSKTKLSAGYAAVLGKAVYNNKRNAIYFRSNWDNGGSWVNDRDFLFEINLNNFRIQPLFGGIDEDFDISGDTLASRGSVYDLNMRKETRTGYFWHSKLIGNDRLLGADWDNPSNEDSLFSSSTFWDSKRRYKFFTSFYVVDYRDNTRTNKCFVPGSLKHIWLTADKKYAVAQTDILEGVLKTITEKNAKDATHHDLFGKRYAVIFVLDLQQDDLTVSNYHAFYEKNDDYDYFHSAFTFDGQTLVYAEKTSKKTTLKFIGIDKFKAKKEFKIGTHSVRQLTYDDSAKLVFWSDRENNIYRLDAYNGNVIPVGSHNGDVNSLHYIRASNRLLSSSSDGTLKLWNLGSDSVVTFHVNLPDDMIVSTQDGFMAGTKNSNNFYALKKPSGEIFSVNQMDGTPDRPDIINNRVNPGSNSTKLIEYLIGSGKTAPRINPTLIPEVRIVVPERNNVACDSPFYRIGAMIKGKSRIAAIEVRLNSVLRYKVENPTPESVGGSIYKLDTTIGLAYGRNEVLVTATSEEGYVSIAGKATIWNNSKSTRNLYLVPIAVSNYAKHPNKKLPTAVKDGRAFCRLFSKQNALYEHVFIDSMFENDFDERNITRINNKLRGSHTDDVILVYFTGHGILDSSMYYYLASGNTDFNDPKKTAVPYNRLVGIFDGVPAQNRLLLVDACYSGETDRARSDMADSLRILQNSSSAPVSFSNEEPEQDVFANNSNSGNETGPGSDFNDIIELVSNYAKEKTGRETNIISSSSGSQKSWEVDNENSIFFGALSKILKGDFGHMEADSNHNNQIDVGELSAALKKEVSKQAKEANLEQYCTARPTNSLVNFVVWEKMPDIFTVHDKGNLKEYFDAGGSVNAMGEDGLSLLALAISHSEDKDFIGEILKRGANPDIKDKTGITPLMAALRHNNTFAVEKLLQYNANPVKSAAGTTPLRYAIQKDMPYEFMLLYARTTDTAARNDAIRYIEELKPRAIKDIHDNKLPFREYLRRVVIFRAIETHDTATFAKNIDSAGYNFTDIDGNTMLHAACKANNTLVAWYLVKKGANVNAINLAGETPLFLASDTNIVKILIASKADPLYKNNSGYTPIHRFAQKQNVEILKLLAALNYSFEITDNRGRTPLHLLISEGEDFLSQSFGSKNKIRKQIYAAAILLLAMKDIDIQDNLGKTPLLLAVEKGHLPLVMVLVEKGANINTADKSGVSPKNYYATQFADRKQKEFLSLNDLLVKIYLEDPKMFDNNDMLITHIGAKNIDSVKAYLNKGANPNYYDYYGKTMVALAIEHRNIQILDLLAAHGADVNLKSVYGTPPVFAAIAAKDTVLLAWLKGKGANFNVIDRDENTALHEAVKTKDMAIVRYIVRQGVPLEPMNKNKETPLQLAEKCCPDIFEYLKKLK